ncbi:ABC transporter-like [Macleaya cordata]|uniref:ABC transporter-like n=1 Tax=Macleaya cordata TaxID=56857 RepID=A0A200Q7R1_MACCD|nr:ABC transporter-like [Macleaya cordata]
MDTGELYRVASLRRNGSSIWRNNTLEIFSRSSRDEDDEEALKWAALEKLPTYNRIRKGILTGEEGEAKEVDIQNLGLHEKKQLIERLLRVAEEDNEKVGIDIPTIEVRYEHLNIDAEAYVGSRALPTILNFSANIVEGVLGLLRVLPSRKKPFSILHDVSGIIKPCRLTLLLGPPSSGKTTLLLALAGKLDKDLKVSGRVTYNGHGMDEFVPQRTSAYISQHDLHIGEMTVRETLAFSARCQGAGAGYDMLAELSRREKSANIKPDPDIDVYMKAAALEGQEASVVTDYILKILGLEICADTMVGDEMLRGISGGQKKRVTTGEMLVGPARALFMDEISTGLDSSTTFQIVNSIRQTIHIMNGTAVISLLQPAPETYDLFDDIILLSDGQIVYQGPRENVLEFFESLGFKCPDRKGVADFLQEVTSKKDQKQYWARKDEPYSFITVKDFSEAFQSFHVGRRLGDELATPFNKSKSHPAALTTKKYGIGKKELLKACASREYLLMKRNSFVYIFKLVQLVIMASITMTVFLRTEMKRNDVVDGGIYIGAMFFTLIMIMFNGFSELAMAVMKLPVFYKQRDLLFYPAWAYSIPTWILKIPITFVEVAVWVFLTYYVIGFDPNVERLFRQYLLLLFVNQMASGLFRTVAAVGRNMIVANTVAAFALIILLALGGFILSRDNVKKWWIWGYWVSPLMYGQNAIVVNEFLGDRWNKVIPGFTDSLGVAVVKSRGFFAEPYWYWIGVGALFGYVLLFNLSFTLALTYLNPFGKPQAVIPEDSMAIKTGEEMESLSRKKSSTSRRSGERGEEIKRSIESTSSSTRMEAINEANQNRKRGMVLPFQPLSITFDEITYSVDMPQEMKVQGVTEDRLELLKGVSGAFRPGVLTALMGVSGAGKTTLMDVLAGRKTGGYIDGSIMISGYPKEQDTFARISGYCEQNDIHSPHVTVYESILYSAWLRLPNEVDLKTRKMFIEEVMELVELTSLKGALVGLPGVNGLSTEQRKRLTIAVELVANPSIIFMDEPTSGLDARAAAIVMRTVRNTVDTGRTVVCTIHQPSIDIFEAFDELFLMKRGGEEIYVGPLGRRSCHLISYFEGIEGVSKIKDGYNPATWMLEVTSAAQEGGLGVNFTEIYRNSELYRRNKELIKELSIAPPGSKDLYFPTKYSRSFFTQCMACLWKQYWSYWRNPPYTAVRFFFTTFIALMFGTIFWDLGTKTSRRQDLFNAVGSMYAAVLFLGVQNTSSVQPVVAVERTVFYRERAAGMYSALPYAFGQVAIEVPYIFFQSAIYGIIVYSMIGFEWTAVKFFWYFFFVFFSLCYFTFYGMMTVAVTPNHNIAAIIASAFYGLWNLFSGFIVPRPRIPIWWRWYYWACPVAWTLYGLAVTQFGDIQKIMDDSGVTVEFFMKNYFGFERDFLPVVAVVVVLRFWVVLMDSGELYRVASLRRNSSSIWRNSAVEVFSRSSRDEDDEEALKWAALEKLPTYNRIRKGLLTGEEGESREVDIQNLGFQEKRQLIERLLRVAEEDNEKFLLKLKNRIDRVGIDIPTIEVRYEHLSVDAEAYVGGRALPTIVNFFANTVEGFLSFLHILPSRKKPFTILHDISGIIKPCRLTLLLGPPSSGKTTLLLALAGKLDKDLKVSGRVTYNGHEMDEFVPQRTSAYISQYDLHIGEMTVRETLAFSARCQGAGTGYDMLTELSRREKAANIKPDPDIDVYMKSAALEGQEASVVTDYILKILGLEICADTMMGDEMVRGISGGQKKRVTTGEMLVGPARALFMDEISTGLDSSTTFQIVNSIRQTIHIMNGTAVISLLQPAPETYDLFDDIILISDQQIVYQGPRENVLEFFESMGFKCPERKGVADFLQEVTSKKDQKQYWAHKDEPYSFISVKDFAEAFQSFHVGRRLGDELATPFDKAKSHPAALTTKKYGISKKELLKACTSREYLLMKRNSFVYIFKLFQLMIIAVIAMTIFLRTEMKRNDINDGVVYMGALFFTLTVILFNGFSELAMTVVKLPVFYKQRDLLFFPAWAYTLPTWILKIPITFAEVAVWVFLTYYVIGFDPNVGRLFKQYFVLLFVHQMASGLFRIVAGIGRDMIVANTIASFALLILLAFSGFILSRENVKKWWIWGYWVSPLMYGQNAIAANEFLGKSWNKVLPGFKEPLGVAVLKSRGLFAEPYWYWIGVGALFGYVLLFNLFFTLALTYLNPLGKPQAVISEDSLSKQNGEEMESLSRKKSSTSRRSGERSEEINRSISTSSSTRMEAINEANQNRKRGMVLPFQPLSITFDEITYSVDMPQEMKVQGVTEDRLELLKGVSGAFRPGVLTALMGVSGAGKTTLMDVLAGRKTGGYIEGSITISGYPKKQETFARISGYCEQNDIHSPHVTVYESILYSAWLRLPNEVDPSTRKMFIEEVMELVELTSLREALVGLPGVNGLSTEQRKRLTIAVELVANPSIIFMDEPTSGLDARAAAIVMRTVRNTVDTGRTVVCTIHQPSIDIFEAFDELFLMKRGGEEIYVGPLGRHSCHLISYFEGIQGVSKIKEGYNPATWMLEVTSPAQETGLGVNFTEVYRNSEVYRRNKELIKELSIPPPASKDLYFPTTYSRSFFSQCTACLWKQYRSYWRNPPYNAVRYFFTAIIALMFGTIFWDLGTKTTRRQDLFNAMGSMYAAVLFLGVQNTSSVQPVVAVERTVFYRERAAGMYSALPYAFGQVAIEIPYVFVQAVIYSLIVYSMIGFEWTVAKFFWYFFFTYFSLLYFTYYGMMTVAVTPNHNIAAIIGSAFYGLWNLFSGFVVPRTRIPIWWRWYYWACPVAWTLYGLVVTQFGDIQERLETGETVEVFLRSYFGFRRGFLPVVAVVVVGINVFFAFVFGFAIRALNFQRR